MINKAAGHPEAAIKYLEQALATKKLATAKEAQAALQELQQKEKYNNDRDGDDGERPESCACYQCHEIFSPCSSVTQLSCLVVPGHPRFGLSFSDRRYRSGVTRFDAN